MNDFNEYELIYSFGTGGDKIKEIKRFISTDAAKQYLYNKSRIMFIISVKAIDS